jgi:DNA-binding NarL/FixJ family response regulator
VALWGDSLMGGIGYRLRGDGAAATAERPSTWPNSAFHPAVLAVASVPAQADDELAHPKTRVLIVDDHRAFSEALAIAVSLQGDLACVGGAGSIAEALALVGEASPDIILMDVRLPDGDGIEATARVRAAAPDALVLILTGHTDVDVLSRAASAGASGFLPKESSIGAVIDTIRAARSGNMLVDGTTLAAILGGLSDHKTGNESLVGAPVLTPREHDVLSLMGQGLDPHGIAASLGISLHTCRGYQKSIMSKLDVHSQLEAVVVATRLRLIPRIAA